MFSVTELIFPDNSYLKFNKFSTKKQYALSMNNNSEEKTFKLNILLQVIVDMEWIRFNKVYSSYFTQLR